MGGSAHETSLEHRDYFRDRWGRFSGPNYTVNRDMNGPLQYLRILCGTCFLRVYGWQRGTDISSSGEQEVLLKHGILKWNEISSLSVPTLPAGSSLLDCLM